MAKSKHWDVYRKMACVCLCMGVCVLGWGAPCGAQDSGREGEAWQRLDEDGKGVHWVRDRKGTLCPAARPLSASWLSPQGRESGRSTGGGKGPSTRAPRPRRLDSKSHLLAGWDTLGKCLLPEAFSWYEIRMLHSLLEGCCGVKRESSCIIITMNNGITFYYWWTNLFSTPHEVTQ